MGNILLFAGSLAIAFGVGGTLFGFGTAGVISGSATATVQAAIGKVAAGSMFTTMTSLGSKDILTGTAIGGGVGTAVVAIASDL